MPSRIRAILHFTSQSTRVPSDVRPANTVNRDLPLQWRSKVPKRQSECGLDAPAPLLPLDILHDGPSTPVEPPATAIPLPGIPLPLKQVPHRRPCPTAMSPQPQPGLCLRIRDFRPWPTPADTPDRPTSENIFLRKQMTLIEGPKTGSRFEVHNLFSAPEAPEMSLVVFFFCATEQWPAPSRPPPNAPPNTSPQPTASRGLLKAQAGTQPEPHPEGQDRYQPSVLVQAQGATAYGLFRAARARMY